MIMIYSWGFDCWVLISRQGAETAAAGILEFAPQDRLVVLRRVSAGSGTKGHTAVVVLRGRLPVSGVGSIGILFAPHPRGKSIAKKKL